MIRMSFIRGAKSLTIRLISNNINPCFVSLLDKLLDKTNYTVFVPQATIVL
jgi:hypothetical protein